MRGLHLGLVVTATGLGATAAMFCVVMVLGWAHFLWLPSAFMALLVVEPILWAVGAWGLAAGRTHRGVGAREGLTLVWAPAAANAFVQAAPVLAALTVPPLQEAIAHGACCFMIGVVCLWVTTIATLANRLTTVARWLELPVCRRAIGGAAGAGVVGMGLLLMSMFNAELGKAVLTLMAVTATIAAGAAFHMAQRLSQRVRAEAGPAQMRGADAAAGADGQ